MPFTAFWQAPPHTSSTWDTAQRKYWLQNRHFEAGLFKERGCVPGRKSILSGNQDKNHTAKPSTLSEKAGRVSSLGDECWEKSREKKRALLQGLDWSWDSQGLSPRSCFWCGESLGDNGKNSSKQMFSITQAKKFEFNALSAEKMLDSSVQPRFTTCKKLD